MTATRRILVVEDDAAIREAVVASLDASGYAWLASARGDAGARLAIESEIDLLLLDVMLPGADGFEALRTVRSARPTLPIIMLTARGAEADRVRGLRLGADDYVVKPFGRQELIARIEAVLRRSAERPTDVRRVAIAGGHVDLESLEATFGDGGRTMLSTLEADLLRYLASCAGRVVSRAELLERVWRLDSRGLERSRTVDMQVKRLREKLRDNGALIRTVRGRGYRFASPECGGDGS
ncbi:MAG: response regulator transcription factor [Phycisphaerales bacterium]